MRTVDFLADRRRVLRAATLPVAAGVAAACSSTPPIPELAPLSANLIRSGWSVDLGDGGAGFRPLVMRDAVWAADAAGRVVRLDPKSGRQTLEIRVEEGILCGVGGDDGVIVVADRAANLRAFDTTGKALWQVAVGADAVIVPAVRYGMVVVRTSDNRTQAFDARSGRRRWVYTRQNPSLVLRQSAGIVIEAATIYLGMPGGRLVALSSATGAVRWEAPVSLPRGSNEIERISDVVGQPVVAGREICAASFQGRVACFDAATGRTDWARGLEAVGGIDVDASLVVACADDGRVYAYGRNGAPAWEQKSLKRRLLSAPLMSGAQVFVGDQLGVVHAIDRADGRLVGRFSTDSTPIVSGPVGLGDRVLIQTSGGGLYAIGTG